MLVEMKRDHEEKNMGCHLMGLILRVDGGAYLERYPAALIKKTKWVGKEV
jgi:hypothetical protein